MTLRRSRFVSLADFKSTVPAMIYGALVVLIAWSALANAIVGITRLANPALALKLSSEDPKALASMADEELLKLAGGQGDARSGSLIQNMALRSLKGEAVNARAIREAGVVLDLTPVTRPHAIALLGLANKVSRRDLLTNMWFIENAVVQQDIAGALKYYDFTLRTEEASQTLLFSTLTNALGERKIRMAFAPYIRARPPWLRDMLTYAIDNSERPEEIAETIQLGGGIPKGLEFEVLEQTLIGRMIETLEFEAAKNFYLSLSGTERAFLTSLSMRRETIDPGKFPLTWGGIKTATIDGTFGTAGPGNQQSLTGTATSGERGLIARKLLFLASGNYEVRAVRDTAAMPANSLATISATCLTQSGTRQIWIGDLKSTKAFPILMVPADCKTQSFDIVLDGGSGQVGAEITVSALSIRKL